MGMRRLAALLAVLALAGCGTASSTAGLKAVPTPTVSADPASLLGFWAVKEDGKQTAVLRFGAELTMFLDCGALEASWKAAPDGGLVAYSASGDGHCFSKTGPVLPDWLNPTQGYRVDGDKRVLVDGAGATLVTLEPTSAPRIPSTMNPDYYGKEPTVSEARSNLVAEASEVPTALEPVTASTLTGTKWLAKDNAAAYLLFKEDGSFTGSDGCNGEGGRYALGQGGEILSVSGPHTLVGCNNSSAGAQLNQAARAARDGDQLVLLDASGHELTRLTAS